MDKKTKADARQPDEKRQQQAPARAEPQSDKEKQAGQTACEPEWVDVIELIEYDL